MTRVVADTNIYVSAVMFAGLPGSLLDLGLLVAPDFVLDVVKDDPDDNRVLECAVAGKADYIVSGDRHLLKLKAHAGIPIPTARQFLDAVAPPS